MAGLCPGPRTGRQGCVRWCTRRDSTLPLPLSEFGCTVLRSLTTTALYLANEHRRLSRSLCRIARRAANDGLVNFSRDGIKGPKMRSTKWDLVSLGQTTASRRQPRGQVIARSALFPASLGGARPACSKIMDVVVGDRVYVGNREPGSASRQDCCRDLWDN